MWDKIGWWKKPGNGSTEGFRGQFPIGSLEPSIPGLGAAGMRARLGRCRAQGGIHGQWPNTAKHCRHAVHWAVRRVFQRDRGNKPRQLSANSRGGEKLGWIYLRGSEITHRLPVTSLVCMLTAAAPCCDTHLVSSSPGVGEDSNFSANINII